MVNKVSVINSNWIEDLICLMSDLEVLKRNISMYSGKQHHNRYDISAYLTIDAIQFNEAYIRQIKIR